jgi:FlgD Ig-like domain
MRYLAPAILGLLSVATVAAFAYAQHLKREPLILDKVTLGIPTKVSGNPAAFTPNGDCVFDNARIRFRVTVSDDANVQIVDPDGRLVRTIVRNRFLKRYRFFTFHWDGRTGRGETAPPGRYKLRVVLLDEGRALRPGGALLLHSAPAREPRVCGRSGGIGARGALSR